MSNPNYVALIADSAIGAFELFIFWVAVACVPAGIAQYKGLSAIVFFIYGLLIPPLALVHATLANSRRIDPVLEELRIQTALLQRFSAAAPQAVRVATAPVKPLATGIAVEPAARPGALSAGKFIEQAKALGLDTGERDNRPYRVLSDGEIEGLRPDGTIDVYANWPAFYGDRPVRTKKV